MRSHVLVGRIQVAADPTKAQACSRLRSYPSITTRGTNGKTIRHYRSHYILKDELRARHTSPPLVPHTVHASRRLKSTDATTIVEKRDEYNPPRSTLPPEVATIERGDKSRIQYLWQLARAFGSFYKAGGKAIFTNRALAGQVRQRLKQETSSQTTFDPFDRTLLEAAINADAVTRSDFQLLRRYNHDFVRLPLFGLLILLVGEWLPLFVPLMPYAVPLTCRIPSQVKGMREKVENRRRLVFRQGIDIPNDEHLRDTQAKEQNKRWPLLDRSLNRSLLARLKSEQVWYLSCVLNLHSRLWETIQQRPPIWLMRSRLSRKLQYIAQDDLLLTRGGKNAASALSEEELRIACEDRGLDVLGPSSKQLQQQLAGWLRRQSEDQGRGTAVVNMLFRRPNSWL